jgi:ribosomal protein S18 acetylase RimI-like enzyme
MREVTVRKIAAPDRPCVRRVLDREWGSSLVASRGRPHKADRLAGLIAIREETHVGLLTYSPGQDDCEIVTMNALVQRRGVGGRLLAEMIGFGRQRKWRRLWLITTNDNVPAQRFYEACGWQLKEIHRGAVEQSRRLKPQIPMVGRNGIPIDDEYEYELVLA